MEPKCIAPGVFGTPGCHRSTLIDLANTALASKSSVEPICVISEGYRTHGGVTGPMNFKKGRFFQKIVLPGFWGPGCHRSTLLTCHSDTLIVLANIALAGRVSREPISMISECYRTHRGVTGPMDFKSRTFFAKSRSRDFGAPGCHPSL